MSSVAILSNDADRDTFFKDLYEIHMGASSATDVQAMYDKWARAYNSFLLDPVLNYKLPSLVAEATAKHLPSHGILHVLDAGCGTGMAGLALAALFEDKSASSNPRFIMDGCDISPAMLDVTAESKVFRNTIQADLNKPLSEAGIADSSYDVIICAGALSSGHVGPESLSGFVSATKSGGIISAGILTVEWEPNGFHAEIEKLVQSGSVEVLQNALEKFWIEDAADTQILVLRKK